jgi:hypothetical protein
MRILKPCPLSASLQPSRGRAGTSNPPACLARPGLPGPAARCIWHASRRQGGCGGWHKVPQTRLGSGTRVAGSDLVSSIIVTRIVRSSSWFVLTRRRHRSVGSRSLRPLAGYGRSAAAAGPRRSEPSAHESAACRNVSQDAARCRWRPRAFSRRRGNGLVWPKGGWPGETDDASNCGAATLLVA